MRKAFLNCGANKGNDILLFREKYGKDYEIFAFEPEPRCYPHLDEIKAKGCEFNHVKAAIGGHDGKTWFYEGQHTVSGSLRQDKFTFMSGRRYEVPVINFSKWLLDNFQAGDEVICLFNIEGGEYEIFPSLFSSGACNLISEFYCEMHAQKLKNFSQIENQKWINKCIDTWGNKCYIYGEHQSDKFTQISSEFWNPNTAKIGKI
tara:strand:- start:307 stop:918 length:612 start_codon:yes stop_codon:yes gene_type:complete